MFNCLNKQKSLKNFLQGKNVSGNFVTKLPYYFQVCLILSQDVQLMLTDAQFMLMDAQLMLMDVQLMCVNVRIKLTQSS